MTRIAELVESYAQGPAALRRAVAGMSPDQLRARPVEGKMSTLEVVCHLADFEPILVDRMKRILAESRPALIGADENKFMAALAYHDRDVEEELAVVELTRKAFARILARQPDTALSREGVHSERGPMTLEKLLLGAIKHIPHHLAFIDEKRKALGISGTSTP